MNVLHVISTVSMRYGGPSVVVRSLSAEQTKQGHEVTVCTTNWDPPDGRLVVSTSEPVVEQGVNIWYHGLDYRPVLFSSALRKWLLDSVREFDVVHVHGLYRFPPTFAAALARRRGIPYLIQPHGSLDPFLYRRSTRSVLLKRLYEQFFDFPNLYKAGAILFTSKDEAVRASFLKLRGPSVVVPNGLDWADFRELPKSGGFRTRLGVNAEQTIILFLGRLNFKKGLDLLIPAFAQVLECLPNAILAVVGPDNEGFGKTVRRWSWEYKVQDRVQFCDHLSAEGVRQAYVDADVFALTSYTENFGMTVAEAMACACPVVISDQVNIWPAVEAARAGIVVPLAVGKIRDALIRVLTDRETGARMGAAGRSLVQERFVWERIVDQLDHVYEGFVHEKLPKLSQRAGAPLG